MSKAVHKPFNYSDEIRGDAITIARVVVVGVAVVVDNAHVGGGLALCGRLPPVAAATTTTVYQRITNAKIKVLDP